MKRLLILAGVLIVSAQAGAVLRTPQSSAAFYGLLNQYPYAVVHYINYDQVADDKLKEQALSSMRREFAQAANDPQYVNANIAFIGINSRVVPDLFTDLETKYKLKKGDSSSQFSVVFLYDNGKPAQDATGYIATLTDAFDKEDLGVFIQQYLGDYIAYKAQQMQAYQSTYPTTVTRYVEQPVYTYTSDPYYYDDYYYRRRPRFGFGLGWGGGWGWRRGWGWGPGVGFGLSF